MRRHNHTGKKLLFILIGILVFALVVPFLLQPNQSFAKGKKNYTLNKDKNIIGTHVHTKLKKNTMIAWETTTNENITVDSLAIREDTHKQPGIVSAFSFGYTGRHLVFSKPVTITIATPGYIDGKDIPIFVKHEGDVDRNQIGLSIDPSTSCTSDGIATKPGNRPVVQNGSITFYTCGASFFQAGYVGGNTTANYADATTKTYTTTITAGTNMPVGSVMTDVTVTLDWQPIDNESATGPWGKKNCYVREKGFTLTSPAGITLTLIKTGALTTPTSNCLRMVYTFSDAGVTQTSTAAAGTYKPALGTLASLNGQSPFGTWTLAMQDTAASDGVILWGFKINITGNAAPTSYTLSPAKIQEGLPIGSVVGTLSTSDPDVGDVFTYSFDTTCVGTYNNTQFTLVGNQLKSAIVFNYTTQPTANICLRTTDQGGLYKTSLTTINIIQVGTVSVSSPSSLTMPGQTVSSTQQTIDKTFSSVGQEFKVIDNKGADSGYTAILQLSGSLKDDTLGYSISAANIGIVGAPSVVLFSGSANPNVQPTSSSTTPFRSLSTPQNIIRRSAGTNNGIKSTYGIYLPLRIIIPARQPAGNYTATLVFTVIEN